ncbi:MAG: hypothetical protein ACRENE_06980, partial [Polyangiaceae bacterium]
MGLARVVRLGSLFAGAAAIVCAAAPLHAQNLGSGRLTLWADRDDDDADGRPDGEEARPGLACAVDMTDVKVDGAMAGTKVTAAAGGEHLRMMGPGGALAWGSVVSRPAWFEGLSPGRAHLDLQTPRGTFHLGVDVRSVVLLDGTGAVVDMARSHASLARTPPARVESSASGTFDDPDALRVVLIAPDDAEAPEGAGGMGVESLSYLGVRIDALAHLPLEDVSCPVPVEQGLRCRASEPLRVVLDDVDRDHPLGAGRSIKGEVGGAIVFRSDGRKAQMIRVLGPRSSPVGPIGRLHATIRPFVVRAVAGGPPAIGGSDANAVASVRTELAAAASIWGQCGITFGDPRSLDVHIVDPPPSHVVALGDGLGLAAGAGQLRFRADGKPITVATAHGETPGAVASDVARAAERAGMVAVVSPNARTGPSLWPSVDVSLRRKDGTLVAVDTVAGAALSTDPTLSVRIGSVDLADGLAHFTDMDATAGTIEERTLVKAFDDGDPTTIEVIVVPLFSGGGRIGESFIGSDLSSVRNVVLLDRAGVRARRSSLTLAHELGHVFMDLP